MLRFLEFENVGPSPHMRLDFEPRLNILTGNNSVGKTFVLDAAWWALTQSWPGKDEKKSMAWPLAGRRQNAKIRFSFDAKTVPDVSHDSAFDSENELWPLRRGRPGSPGLVLYLRIDGGFSLWDPARNYWKRIEARDFDDPDRPKAFHFDMEDIWNGLRSNGTGPVFCEGLLSDWKTWKDRKGAEYALLCDVLKELSPSAKDLLSPGKFTGISITDVREVPSLDTPYGPVPVTLASAGVKRVLALAYLITWAHVQHLRASELLGDAPSDRFAVLIDEVELHLHPQWQRVILPAVLKVIKKLGEKGAMLSGNIYPQIQIIAATHAPLVMASIETRFNPALDKVFHFQINDGGVSVEGIPWAPQGDAVGWLVSEIFGLSQARSYEAEKAIEAAEAYMRGDMAALSNNLSTKEAIHAELLRVLPGHDPFWPRWVVQTEQRQ